jgi:tripartite-type tricarboxylate transporter receptor subunit TctC
MAAGSAGAAGAVAPFPTKPLRWISPFAAGGGSDLTTRAVAQKLSERVGQPVVVDNRVGASGSIGASLAGRAPADGHTLVTLTVSMVTHYATLQSAPYDLIRDFTPLTQMTSQPYVLIVHPSVAAPSVKELLAVARAKPGTLHYGSSGIATLQHLAGALLANTTRTDLVHVPYKGGAPALTDLMSGQLQFFFGVAVSSMPLIKAGKVRALAVTSRKRSVFMPDLPTVAESGVPGYSVDNWYGVLAPAGIPREVASRLERELAGALAQPDLKERLARDGSDAMGGTSTAFAMLIRSDLAQWRRVINETGIKVE